MIRADPMLTRIWVLKPAGRPMLSLSIPIRPPKTKAKTSRMAISKLVMYKNVSPDTVVSHAIRYRKGLSFRKTTANYCSKIPSSSKAYFRPISTCCRDIPP